MLKALRRLRHGRLSRYGRLWVSLGHIYRSLVGMLPFGTTSQMIGSYGPFRMDMHFGFSNFESWGSGHNNGFTATVEACRGKRCVFDIGGHVGLVTLPVSRVLAEGGRVITFEPATANLRFLHRHLLLNRISNVEVIEALVGDQDGLTSFFEQRGPTGQNSVVVRKNAERYVETQRQQISLDRFCEERGLAPEVLKIDVEGGELMVLRGARKTLAQHRPEIFLSVHPRELQILGSSVEQLASLITELGYVYREIDGAPVNHFRLAEYHLLPK